MRGWAPLTQRLAGATAVPLFTSLAGMASAWPPAGTPSAASRGVRHEQAEPGGWVAIGGGACQPRRRTNPPGRG